MKKVWPYSYNCKFKCISVTLEISIRGRQDDGLFKLGTKLIVESDDGFEDGIDLIKFLFTMDNIFITRLEVKLSHAMKFILRFIA